MDLEARVAELERRLTALESTERGPSAAPPGGPPAEDDFRALQALKDDLAATGARTGGVLFTGAVRLPTDERYEWQYAALTDDLLGADDRGETEGGDTGDTGGGGRPGDAVPGRGDAGSPAPAEVFAALGHEVRLRLLREILAGRRTAAELAGLAELGTTGQIYHHLRQLTGAGWLHSAGRGRYEVPPTRVVPLLVMLSAARRP